MVFSNFPKERKILPPEYQEIYDNHYKENREGKSNASFLAQKLEGWMHRKVAKSAGKHLTTLEIGAGTLNQLPYENTEHYDIVEPYEALYKNSKNLYRIKNIFNDIKNIENIKYDRIISIAAFEHILDLPDAVAVTTKLLASNGCLCVAIPNEGRFLWKLAYTLTTGREFKKRYGLDYSVLMNYEHCNTADEIEEILKYFYESVSMKLFGVNKTFALYRYYECKKQKQVL